MGKSVVVIYQQQYEELLRNSIIDNVAVVWIPAEMAQDDEKHFEQEVGQIYNDNPDCVVSLMVSWRSYKEAVWKVLQRIGINCSQIFSPNLLRLITIWS